MKKKAYIPAIISAFAVFGFVFFILFTTIKDKYFDSTTESDEITTVSSVDVGNAKRSVGTNVDGGAEGVPNIDIPELAVEKKRIKTATINSQSGSEQVVMAPYPNYTVSNNGNRSTGGAVPNSTSGGAGGKFSNNANLVHMFTGALSNNSKDDQKSKTTGFISTTIDLTNPRVLTGQKQNGGSPPPEEKDPISGSLPIGDGWYFLMLMGVVYACFKKWLL